MHLVHPQKVVFNFSWDDCDTQKKFRGNNGQHAFFFGGVTRCIMVYVKMVNFGYLANLSEWDAER